MFKHFPVPFLWRIDSRIKASIGLRILLQEKASYIITEKSFAQTKDMEIVFLYKKLYSMNSLNFLTVLLKFCPLLSSLKSNIDSVVEKNSFQHVTQHIAFRLQIFGQPDIGTNVVFSLCVQVQIQFGDHKEDKHKPGMLAE